ncbi:MAG: hypothetical protein HYT62_02390 [Candidatus Yanofskybacteria bacterium]|nr:hypothetical protein [Candidatus Yanofskybacteria bacterium]
MKNTSFIAISLVTALIVSVFGFTASAQSVPSVTTGSVMLQSQRSGFMYGSVNPNGSGTYVRAEIGTSTAFGRVYGPQWIGNGTSPVDVQFGFINLRENTTYYYRIIAQTGGRVVNGETKTFITSSSGGSSNNNNNNNNNNSGNTVDLPTVFTNGPASVLSNSAVINGTINPNGSSGTFWFEFGKTSALGQTTSVQSFGISNSGLLATGDLSGLQSGTIYYYRIAARNSSGIVRGNILNFTTQGGQAGGQVLGSTYGNGGIGINTSGSSSGNTNSSTIKKTASNKANTVQERPSFASLEYSIGNDGSLVLVADDIMPEPGEEFSYTIVYKNDTEAIFRESNLKIILPVQVDYIGSDRDPSNISANIVEFNLDDISPRSQGAVVIIVKVKETVEPGTNMIFTSVLGYKNSKGVQLANTAYMIIRVSGVTAPFSASISSSIGMSGVLWLIAIILVAMMGLLVFRLVRMRKNTENRDEEDIFDPRKIPSTFEPIGKTSAFGS